MALHERMPDVWQGTQRKGSEKILLKVMCSKTKQSRGPQAWKRTNKMCSLWKADYECPAKVLFIELFTVGKTDI